MAIISRGFSGRRSAADVKLPPGQYLTTDFPVLSAGPTPHLSLDRWEFAIDDGTDVLKRWNWKSFRDLPTETFTVDLHCVTRWSKLGTVWEGVSLDTMLAGVKTDAECHQCTEHEVARDARNEQAAGKAEGFAAGRNLSGLAKHHDRRRGEQEDAHAGLDAAPRSPWTGCR